MTITREEVLTLREGDVVELFHSSWPEGTVVRGALYHRGPAGRLYCAGFAVHWGPDDVMSGLGDSWTLTLIERGPQPLYVNHDRAEPFSGDIVCDADAPSDHRLTYVFADDDSFPWRECMVDGEWLSRDELPKRLRLLIDGETGAIVP